MIEIRLLKALVWIVAAKELNINEQQKQMIIDEKGIGTIEMSPLDFLRLTTPNKAYIDQILNDSKSLEFYNSSKAKSYVHPFLNFDRKTGKIEGHEGRHRAAAVHKAGGHKFVVALFPRPGHRYNKLSELPTTLKGEFSSFKYDIDYEKDLIDQEMFNFQENVYADN